MKSQDNPELPPNPLVPLNSNRLVLVLGFTQILIWSASYYLPAVFAKSIAAETGWPLSQIVAGLTVGLLTGAVCSPQIGAIIQKHGGRPVLSASSAIASVGLLVVALSNNLPMYFLGWFIIGLAMGAGMYDAVFATFGVLYGRNARKAITNLTLISGFASTFAWPVGALLEQTFGWRGACLAYAALHLLLSLPSHLLLIPSVAAGKEPAAAQQAQFNGAGISSWFCRDFFLLAIVVSASSAISGSVAVNLRAILQSSGHSLSSIVTLGALIGPSMVIARIVEKISGEKLTPPQLLATSAAMIAAGVTGLLLDAGLWAGPALVSFGAGVGIGAIARGTVPMAIFGPDTYPSIVGKLAMPALVSQAFAPSLSAALLDWWDTRMLLYCLSGVSLVSLAVAAFLAISLNRSGKTGA